MKQAPHVLILFRDFSSVYRRNLVTVTDVARACGHECIVIVANGVQLPVEAVVKRVEHCGAMEDVAAVRSLAARIAAETPIERVMALFEDDVITAGLIRDDLGIHGPSADIAISFRNKTVMHTRAAELGIPVPRSCLPLTWKIASDFAAEVGFPVVLKPSGGHGAMNTYRIDDAAELEKRWRSIGNQREVYRLEKYVEGDQYHVDCVVRGSEIVFFMISRYTANLLNYSNEPGGTVTRQESRSPGELKILEVNQRFLRAIGLQEGITHGEYYLTAAGDVFLGEIGARPPGGSILPTIEAATGVDMVRVWAFAEMAETFERPVSTRGEAATRFLASREHGRLVAQTSQDALLAMDGMVAANLWRTAGDVIGNPQRSSDFLGYVIARGATSAEAVERVQRAADAFKVETTPISSNS